MERPQTLTAEQAPQAEVEVIPVARTTLRYRGRRVSVVEVHGKPHLFIDGEHILTSGGGRAKSYWASHLPYRRFSDLRDLAKAVIDYRALDESNGRRRGGRR